MPSMVERKCKCCKKDFKARAADVARGWGLFCSKSCKAKVQEKKNGQYKAYKNGRGVSNLHPERLKYYSDSCVTIISGCWFGDSDPFNPEWREIKDDTHPFSSEGLGQW